eukprot:379354-Karenia_brevis.AAC.1
MEARLGNMAPSVEAAMNVDKKLAKVAQDLMPSIVDMQWQAATKSPPSKRWLRRRLGSLEIAYNNLSSVTAPELKSG